MIDYYIFGTHARNPSIYHTYITNIDLLDRFICILDREVNQSKNLLKAYDLIINPDKKNFDATNQKYAH